MFPSYYTWTRTYDFAIYRLCAKAAEAHADVSAGLDGPILRSYPHFVCTSGTFVARQCDKYLNHMCWLLHTVNSEIFARILFSRKALKYIFATLFSYLSKR